jgi:hypothetical protein|tara:strand:+ start:889 stop:1557 length:669 start_codon:yes stop_codon:yes gene_type:complete
MTEKPTNLKGKTCGKCKKEKPFPEFHKRSASKDGYRRQCKLCVSLYWKKMYPIFGRSKAKIYCDEHREEMNAYAKLYNARNKETLTVKRNAWHRKKLKSDPIFKLRARVSGSIRTAFKQGGFLKDKRSHEVLKCSILEFKVYIEKQFKEGMTWKNYGEWQLDHAVPHSLGITAEEVIALNHYSNFQPLWKEDNLKKADKLTLDIISPENKIRYKEIIERAQK